MLKPEITEEKRLCLTTITTHKNQCWLQAEQRKQLGAQLKSAGNQSSGAPSELPQTMQRSKYSPQAFPV